MRKKLRKHYFLSHMGKYEEQSMNERPHKQYFRGEANSKGN